MKGSGTAAGSAVSSRMPVTTTDDLTLFRPLLPLVSHKRGPRQVADCVEPPLRFNYHQD